MNKIKKFVQGLHNPDLGLLFVRIALALVFINAGWSKVQDIESVIVSFGQIGFGPGLAYLVAYCELLGGIAVLLGVLVRYAGIIISIIMLVALVKVHLPLGFGESINVIMLLLLALSVVTQGAGKHSLAKKMGNKWE